MADDTGFMPHDMPHEQGGAHRRKFAFLCLSSDFFVGHFAPAIAAARLQGFEVTAFLPAAADGAKRPPEGVTIVPIKARRAPALAFLPSLFSTISVLREQRPDVVQAFALQACVILILASAFVAVRRKILTITGLGFLDVDDRWRSRVLRSIVYGIIRLAGLSKSTWFVFENSSDRARLGFRDNRPANRLTLMGAGVDHRALKPVPAPSQPPLRIAIVSRMIWTKGIDLAVEAVSRLVRRGVAVELDLYGAADRHNPRAFADAVLQEWCSRPGIRWHGHVSDIASVWAGHHVGLFPSRGGEGLPRALLEAAACGRALIVTEVPGCADFVRTGIEGVVVRPYSVDAIAEAIETLVAHPELLVGMGHAARQRLVANATEDIITARYRRFLTDL
ncbi:MAG: glycosyltransferase [Hyphomicrobiales bacterium]|nr:glycosyltransferase [Hyphomicrobiales bacterium]